MTLQQAKQFAHRYKLDMFLFDESCLSDRYLMDLEKFFAVLSWFYEESEKYGPDGPSGREVARKLQNNQAATVICHKHNISLFDVTDVMMDDQDPDVLKSGCVALRRNLRQQTLAVRVASEYLKKTA